MNEYKQCNKCGEWHWSAEPCPELFLIIDPDYLGEEKKEVYAWSFDDAAGRYAKFRELVPTSGKVKFNVQKASNNEVLIYQVYASVEVYYTVKEENSAERTLWEKESE